MTTNTRKLRILWCGEAAYLNTGYGVYDREVLSRLHETGKYEIAELASYGHWNDKRKLSVPWTFYGNLPDTPDDEDAYLQSVINQFGCWKFEETCLDFRPDVVWDIRDWWMCLTGTANIVTQNGLVNIKHVQQGDKVLAHTGKLQQVIKTMSRQYRGKFHTIATSHCPFPVTLTQDHPVLAVKRTESGLQCDIPTWINSQDIQEKDLLVFPVEHFGTKYLNHDLCRLIGYYTAEGCILYEGRKINGKYKGIQLVFHSNETDYIEDVINIAHKIYNTQGKVKLIGNTAIVRFYGANIAKDMCSYAGELSGNKMWSTHIMSLTKGCLKQVLCGALRGDGGIYETRASYVTKSEQLAHQVFRLCVRLGILPSFNKNRNTIGDKVYHRYIFSFAAKSLNGFRILYNNTNEIIVPCKRIKNGYAYLTVKSVAQKYEEDTVYNLEVENDNSYVSSFTVHNCEFAERSPFRDFYKWTIMPTIDSAPLPDRWVYTYRNADALCAYSEFGRDVMEGKKMVVPGTAWDTEIENARVGKVLAMAPPAADFDVLKPTPNKKQHQSLMGFKDNVLIVGTVMRNQKRKMYPELLRSFRILLEENPSLANRTFLYIHTSYPDIGWDMPRLLREEHLSHKVLFTYVCSHCGNVQPLFFQDAKTTCLACGRPTAALPSTQAGVSKEQLADILNTMDVYVQYSICEGFGMPQLEAAACGVPIMAVDYSAMTSVLKNLKGIPIKPLCVTRESETHAYRAIPDNRDFVAKLAKFLRQPEAMRLKKGRETYKAARKHYSWDKTASVWEKWFDKLDIQDQAKTWDSPARIHEPNLQIPDGLSYEQLVKWGFANIWGRPQMAYSYVALKMMRDLNYGFAITDTGDTKFNEGSLLSDKQHYVPFTREDAIRKMLQYNQLDTQWEQKRTAKLAMTTPLYIANK